MNVLLKLLSHLVTRPFGQARLPVLIYHRVRPAFDPLFPDIDGQAFSAQMKNLAAVFRVLPIADAVDRLYAGTLPARSACVTFDDGYRDNVDVALPILLRHKIPAAFFVASGYLDGRCMWNDALIEGLRETRKERLDLKSMGLGEFTLTDTLTRRKAIRSLIINLKHLPQHEREQNVNRILEKADVARIRNLMINSNNVAALHRAGMTIGGHTVSHPILARLPANVARQEIEDNKSQLEDIIGERLRYFAYPNGKPGQDFCSDHIAMLRGAGYEAAFSTALGTATAHTDRYQLPRFRPAETGTAIFSLRIFQQCLNVTPNFAA